MMNEYTARVLDVIAQSDYPLTPGQIRMRVPDIPSSQVQGRLQRLSHMGRIRKIRMGKLVKWEVVE